MDEGLPHAQWIRSIAGLHQNPASGLPRRSTLRNARPKLVRNVHFRNDRQLPDAQSGRLTAFAGATTLRDQVRTSRVKQSRMEQMCSVDHVQRRDRGMASVLSAEQSVKLAVQIVGVTTVMISKKSWMMLLQQIYQTTVQSVVHTAKVVLRQQNRKIAVQAVVTSVMLDQKMDKLAVEIIVRPAAVVLRQ